MFNVRLKGISYCIHVMSDIVVLVSDCFYTIFLGCAYVAYQACNLCNIVLLSCLVFLVDFNSKWNKPSQSCLPIILYLPLNHKKSDCQAVGTKIKVHKPNQERQLKKFQICHKAQANSKPKSFIFLTISNLGILLSMISCRDLCF